MMSSKGEIIKNITNADLGEFVATAISPSGDRLLFYQVAPGYPIDVAMNIYIYNFQDEVITGPITNGDPGNFSPDGKNFVFDRHTYGEDGGYNSIYLYNLTTHTEKNLPKMDFIVLMLKYLQMGKKFVFNQQNNVLCFL